MPGKFQGAFSIGSVGYLYSLVAIKDIPGMESHLCVPMWCVLGEVGRDQVWGSSLYFRWSTDVAVCAIQTTVREAAQRDEGKLWINHAQCRLQPKE